MVLYVVSVRHKIVLIFMGCSIREISTEYSKKN